MGRCQEHRDELRPWYIRAVRSSRATHRALIQLGRHHGDELDALIAEMDVTDRPRSSERRRRRALIQLKHRHRAEYAALYEAALAAVNEEDRVAGFDEGEEPPPMPDAATVAAAIVDTHRRIEWENLQEDM